jgi:hypothetical protein
MKVICKKCGKYAEAINRGLVKKGLKGYDVVCLKNGFDDEGNRTNYGGCGHIEMIHKDEFRRLEKLPLENRIII